MDRHTTSSEDDSPTFILNPPLPSTTSSPPPIAVVQPTPPSGPLGTTVISAMSDSAPPHPSGGSTEETSFPPLPPAPPSHVAGQGYSANHPVPTVQSYKAAQARHEDEAKQYADIVAKRRAEAEARDQGGAEKSGVPQSGDIEEVGGNEGNALKNQKGMKDDTSAQMPANEKQRMMQQMNSNQGGSSSSRFDGPQLIGVQSNPLIGSRMRKKARGGSEIQSLVQKSSSKMPIQKARTPNLPASCSC